MSAEDTWQSPTAKSRFRVIERDAERLIIEFENQPDDVGPPEHLHPTQEEEFSVLDGELLLRVGGREVRLAPGQSFLVPRGTAHTFRNPGTRPVRFTSQHRPPLGFERFLKTIYDLDADGRSDRRGQPGLLQTMVLLRAHPDEQLLAGPPRGLQRAVIAVLGALGRALGYRPEYVSQRRRVDA